MENEFKAWDVKNKKWLEEFYISQTGKVLIPNFNYYPREIEEIDNVIIVNFIGRYDINNKKIYNGYFLQDNTVNYCKYIAWIGNGFKWKSILNQRGLEKQRAIGKLFPAYDYEEIQNTERYKIIGNIYEKSLLIKQS